MKEFRSDIRITYVSVLQGSRHGHRCARRSIIRRKRRSRHRYFGYIKCKSWTMVMCDYIHPTTPRTTLFHLSILCICLCQFPLVWNHSATDSITNGVGRNHFIIDDVTIKSDRGRYGHYQSTKKERRYLLKRQKITQRWGYDIDVRMSLLSNLLLYYIV